METNKDLTSLLNEAKKDGIEYINKRIKWLQVSYQIRSAKFISSFMYSVTLTLAVLLVLFFMLISIALLLGRFFEDYLLGFFCMGVISLLIVSLIVLLKKQLKSYLLNRAAIFVAKMDRNDEEIIEEDDSEEKA